MPDIKWIKLSTTIFDDEKIRLIEAMPDADALLIIWVKLLCQAGRVNADGYIFLSRDIPFSDENLATLFQKPLNTIRFALQMFQQLQMISIDENGVIYLPNWAKHQNIEGLEKIREQARLRQQKYRAKLLLTMGDETSQLLLTRGEETSRDRNVTVTQQNKIKNKNIYIYKKKEKKEYGVFSNVLLTEDEYQKLVARFSEVGTLKRIEELSEGVASKGYKYKSHYAAILSWHRKDEKEAKKNEAYRGNPKRAGTKLPDRHTGYTEPPYDPKLEAFAEAERRDSQESEC